MAHHNGGAWHCTGALSELAPPEGYSTSTHVGFLSCGPSLRARLRSDADARANTETDDALADAHSCALADARADHRRAGRRAVGYELL
jgi:hypothetical protein